MIQKRLYKLSPWIIRILIPSGTIGTYILYEINNESICLPVYIGRSDIDLRNRLMQHALNYRAHFFEFMIQSSPENAYIVECSLYHALGNNIRNIIHPDKPNGIEILCPFCRKNYMQGLLNKQA